jgi:hypothetical protein
MARLQFRFAVRRAVAPFLPVRHLVRNSRFGGGGSLIGDGGCVAILKTLPHNLLNHFSPKTADFCKK